MTEKEQVISLGEQVFYKTYNRFPVVFDHGKGMHLYDTEGNQYLDFGAGIAVMSLGYGDNEFTDALKSQMDKLTHTSNLFYNEPAVKAGEKLLEASEMEKVFFTNSGTEAIEGALKIARRYAYNKKQKGQGGAGEPEIIAMVHSFHGRSMGALSVTGNTHYQEPFQPLLPGMKFARYNDLESVKELVTENTCAVILETVQGEGGIYPAEKEFLTGIRNLCDEKDMLLILDEVQCGMGRTGQMFAWQHYGVKPDVMAVAKALGNGVPIGAFLACGKAAIAMVPGDHGSTYGGNPLVCAAAASVLDIFKKRNLLSHVREMGQYLWEKLEEVKNNCEAVTGHRGIGLMQGLQFAETMPVGTIVNKALLEEKLVLISAADNTIRFIPPLIVEKEEIDQMISRLLAVIGN